MAESTRALLALVPSGIFLLYGLTTWIVTDIEFIKENYKVVGLLVVYVAWLFFVKNL